MPCTTCPWRFRVGPPVREVGLPIGEAVILGNSGANRVGNRAGRGRDVRPSFTFSDECRRPCAAIIGCV